MKDVRQIPQLIRQLLEIVKELERRFPGRRFTLDGHLVGSLGEVFAAYCYRLELLSMVTKKHDARTQDGRFFQIKTTQRARVGLRSRPDYLLVLRILPDGKMEEVYNGPGALAWQKVGERQSNGQHFISLSKLTKLMENIPEKDRLPRLGGRVG